MREDRIISALIGLVGACDNNPKTAGTDSLVIKALAFPLIYPEYGDRELQGIVNDIYAEKNSIALGCAVCAAACHEGAIEIIDGKAVLNREDYCDGLGDCLPECPLFSRSKTADCG